MSSYADRLAALRDQLKADRLDGFVVPLTDEHMSEYVGPYAQGLAWPTGFQGRAGGAGGSGPGRGGRGAAGRRAYERICRHLCAAARLAYRVRRVGGLGGG